MSDRAVGKFFDDPDALFTWINTAGITVSVVNALNQAGVIDQLLDGAAHLDDLSVRAGIPADKLGRLLDFLVAHELAQSMGEGVFAPNHRTAKLQLYAAYLHVSNYSRSAGECLTVALQEGVTPFEKRYGQPVFDYFGAHPQEAATFGEFMGFMTSRVQRFVVSSHRFEPFETVADLGGSMGDFLLGLLGQYPQARGILFDLPDTVEIARPKVAASAMAGRVELQGGDFFQSVPSADLYTLKQILHDWDDAQCVQILGSIRKAINPGGRVAVIDHIVAEMPTPDEAQITDISMMIWDRGRERKRADFENLFAQSGFGLARITHNSNGHSVIEAVPV